jgi:ketosteroid isomerase-like protein
VRERVVTVGDGSAAYRASCLRDTGPAMPEEPATTDPLELVRRGLKALNANDPDAFIAVCDPRFQTHLISVVGEPVLYEGPDGIRQFVRDMEESWSWFGFEIESMRDLGDRILVIGDFVGRGRASGVEVASRRALIIEVRDALLTSLRFFLEVSEALEAAGLED